MGDKVTFAHYRVLQRANGSHWELGRSAIGVTYKALDTDLQRPVTLRVINSALVADKLNRERFLREARAAAGLRHGNIASIYHLGNDEEQFFYAMEFIEGQTIDSYVGRYGPMPLRAALHVAWQVSKALVAAARQQLVHGDIKPANIMILDDSEEGDWPFIKLLNFGIVRPALAINDFDNATQPGPLATVQSGSPEQTAKGNLEARSDIYSLGCTLWYLLTGEAPSADSPIGDFAPQRPGDELPWACRIWSLFTGEGPVAGSTTNASTQQLGSEPAWEKLEPFPKRVRRLLRRMLRKEGWQRPASVMQLQREIEQCLIDVERHEALAARMALPLNIAREWFMAAPWPGRAAIFGAPLIGVVLALGYYWNSDPLPRSAPAMPTSGVVRPQDSANPNQWLAREMSGWSYLRGWDEPFRSLALAPLLSFAEPVSADPGVIGAKSWAHADSIWEGAAATALASDYPSSVAADEDQKVAVAAGEDNKPAVRKAPIRGKSQVKKTSKRYGYANYAKKQRRVTRRSKAQTFDPLRMVQQARQQIKSAIRRIF
jgi:serine/threonine protein kinase